MLTGLLLTAMLALSTTAAAQAPTPTPAPEVPEPQPVAGDPVEGPQVSPGRRAGSGMALRPRLFGLAGFQTFSASESFSAVLGSSSGTVLGGGGGVLIGRHLFVDVSVSQFSADGSRVFIADGGEVIDLGIATDVSVRSIDVSIGWRFTRAPSVGPTGRLRLRPVPFAGGGFGVQRYRETAEFASGDDDVSESHGSYHVLGGLEVPVSRRLGVSADVLYRWVPDGLGTSGVSAYYDETDLGGVQARVRVLFTF